MARSIMSFKGDKKYDAIVETDRVIESTPSSASPDSDEYRERVRAVKEWRELYNNLMWNGSTTPEELLAAQMVSVAGGRRYEDYWQAEIRWPWGDATGWLIARGRTHDESRLRLRDKLVESARKVIADSK